MRNKIVTVCKQASVIARGVMKTKCCRGLGCMPLIEVFGGDVCELFAVCNDVALCVDEFVKFPIGASSVEQFASLAEVPSVEPGLLACPVEPCEFGLKFCAMPSMK